MNPLNISFEDLEECLLSPSFFDKATQTSEIKTSDSKPSLKRERTVIKGCEINESDADGNKENSSCENLRIVLSERYSYCQQILQPYLKKFSSEYSRYVEAKEKFIDATDESDGNDQLCKIIHPGEELKAMSPCDKNDRSKSRPIHDSLPSCSVSADCPDEPQGDDTCCCCNNEPRCIDRPKCPPPLTECERKPNPCDKIVKKTNECELKKCITKCVRETIKSVKKDQSHCETVIGVIPSKDPKDKPIFYPLNRLKERGAKDCPLKKSHVQEKLEASNEALKTMTGNVGSFLCKVYNKTREVVGLAATNSCRHLGLSNDETHAQDSESKESCCKRSGKRPRKNCSATKCLFESTDKNKPEVTDNVVESVGTSTEILPQATAMIDKICSTVKTSISSIGGQFTFENLMDVVTFPKPDRSSPYDVPTRPPTPPQIAHIPPPTPPKQYSTEALTPVHSGMVKSVANKICSIFRYGRKSSVSSIPAAKLNEAEKKDEDDDDDDDDTEDLNNKNETK